ncbi:hypothetical protein Bbelb_047550 [Branchiostoma belcheri]|nr:hypothetical protein Bbelb_047550 [Branchiostoma belcheri]
MKTFPASVLAAMTFLCFYGNASGRFASRRRASTVRRPTGSIDSGSSTSCSQGTCGDRVLLDSTVLDTSKSARSPPYVVGARVALSLVLKRTSRGNQQHLDQPAPRNTRQTPARV